MNDCVYIESDGKKEHFGPDDFVRPLGSLETTFAIAGLHNNANAVQAIWLQSTLPIESHTVEEALVLLSRNIHVLRLCVQRRGLKLWFKVRKDDVIDFNIRNNDATLAFQEVLNKPYDMGAGPLWRASLVNLNDDNSINSSNSNFGHYKYALIFGVQHCITDGTTNMYLCREVVQTINRLLTGRKTTPRSVMPLSPLLDNINTSSIFSLIKEFYSEAISPLIFNFNWNASFQNRLPIPSGSANSTKILSAKFTKDLTEKLLAKCKAERVTINTYITTASNFALLKTASDKSDVELPKSLIKAMHSVDNRRYYSPHLKSSLGCHISLLETTFRLSIKDYDNFWNVARNLQNEVNSKLKERKSIKIAPIYKLFSPIYLLNACLTNHSLNHRTALHYLTSNMGLLKYHIPEPHEEDCVYITDVLRCVSNSLGSNCFLIACHTFRKHLSLSMDYYTTKMSDETAQEFFNELCCYIKDLCQ